MKLSICKVNTKNSATGASLYQLINVKHQHLYAIELIKFRPKYISLNIDIILVSSNELVICTGRSIMCCERAVFSILCCSYRISKWIIPLLSWWDRHIAIGFWAFGQSRLSSQHTLQKADSESRCNNVQTSSTWKKLCES